MKKRPRIVFCLAALVVGLTGQMSAFGLDATYSIFSVDTFSIGGVGHSSSEQSQTCTFRTNDTFDLYDGTYHYTGTYALVKKGKQIEMTLDANGQAAIASNTVEWIQNMASDNGITLENLSVSIQRITLANVTMKNGVPFKETSTVHGKATAIVEGKLMTKSFTHKSVKINWSEVTQAREALMASNTSRREW